MALTTERNAGGDGPASEYPAEIRPVAPAAVRPADGGGLWFAAAALLRRRWLIVGVTVLVAAASVGISLLLPNWYRAETRVMLPESNGSSMSALVESVAPGAGALLGGSGGDYTRYLAILTSRTVMERAVERFDLVQRYETADEPAPVSEAVKELTENTTFEVSLEYNFLAVHVLDKDPRVAAQIANFFVSELNRENTRLSSDRAREQRLFVQTRMLETEAALDSVRAELQAVQEQYGIAEPVAQGEALMGAVAEATSAVAQTRIQFESLNALYGEENEQVGAARAALEAAQGELAGLTSGGSEVMPVPLRQLPQVGRRFGQLQQEMMIQAKILEFIRPMYEQALFDERRVTSAVQVIDEAVPPARKAEPKRALIVIGATLSGFILACAFVIAIAVLRRGAPTIAERLRTAA